MDWQPYSHRNDAPKDVLERELTDKARRRILINLEQVIDTHMNSVDYHNMIVQAGRLALAREGLLSEISLRETMRGIEPITSREGTEAHVAGANHFLAAPTDKAIDFLEFCFRTDEGKKHIEIVETVNSILREEGIGFEFTQYKFGVAHQETRSPFGELATALQIKFVSEFPEAIKKSDTAIHQQVVMPALHVVSRSEFAVANAHLLKAHEHHRKGNNRREAIVEALAALESTIKVICQAKGWPYQENKDPIGPLVKILADNQLIYDFYNSVIVGAATVRNRMAGHGQEKASLNLSAKAHKSPVNAPVPTDTHVEHMIHMVSAHILLLVRLAGMA